METLRVLADTQKLELESPAFREDAALEFVDITSRERLKHNLILVNAALGQAALDQEWEKFASLADASDKLTDRVYGRVFRSSRPLQGK